MGKLIIFQQMMMTTTTNHKFSVIEMVLVSCRGLGAINHFAAINCSGNNFLVSVWYPQWKCSGGFIAAFTVISYEGSNFGAILFSWFIQVQEFNRDLGAFLWCFCNLFQINNVLKCIFLHPSLVHDRVSSPTLLGWNSNDLSSY